jgi:hypothetical protein
LNPNQAWLSATGRGLFAIERLMAGRNDREKLANPLREDDIPIITCFLWKFDTEHGNVIIRSKHRIDQNLILDQHSSQIWLKINGKNSIADLRMCSDAFDLDQFLSELEQYGVISYRRILEEIW